MAPGPIARDARAGRRRIAALGACVAALACARWPDAAHAALASAAGTLFEAAPVVFAAAAVPSRLRGVAGAAGCGCGTGGLPGACAPAAVALCWIAFGPAAALTRAAASLAVRRLTARHGVLRGPSARRRADPAGDPFAELLRLGAGAGLASVVSAAALPYVHGPAAGAVAGIVLGLLAPCASAGVAIAGAVAPHAPAAAVAILATAGVVPRDLRRPLRGDRGSDGSARRSPLPDGTDAPGFADARFAAVLVAAALALLAWRGPSGLVHPRLLPFAAAGAIAAAAYAARRPGPAGSRGAVAVPVAMVLALATGSPVPRYAADETTAAAAFPGERGAFAGTARTGAGGPTRLVRYVITCCRIDAAAIAVTLDRALPVADGTWVSASGTFHARGDATELATDRWRRIDAPADPFVYR